MSGLRYPDDIGFDLAQLPVLVHRPEPHAPIRALTAAQFARLKLAHDCLDTPDSVLFPFLHGLESGNTQQLAFFQRASAVPDYRGLVWVLATDDDQLPSLFDDSCDTSRASPPDSHAEDGEEDLFEDEEEEADEHAAAPPTTELYANDIPNGYQHTHRGSVSSSTTHSSSEDSVLSAAESWNSHTTDTSFGSNDLDDTCSVALSSSSCMPFAEPPASLLGSSFLPSELLSISSTGPVFTAPNVPDGVSLRNFGIQLPVYATLSDVVVYSPSGATRTAISVAERFKTAIEAKFRERQQTHSPTDPPLLSYNVFVVTEPFAAFHADLTPLVAVASNGDRTSSYPDLAEREKEEMRRLTAASEILPGVFLGNAADVPMWRSGDSEDPTDGSSNNPRLGDGGYDLCVECQDGAPFPGQVHLRQAEDHIAALDQLWATSAKVQSGSDSASQPVPVLGTPRTTPRPAPNANAVLHLSCPSSPFSTQANITSLITLAEFLVRLSRDGSLHSTSYLPKCPVTAQNASIRRPMRVLVHSADGYTDSSVLALTLLMFARRCSLPEAYLELQNGRQRSFFVYPQDLPLLRRIEQRIAALHPPSVPATVSPIQGKREREREQSRGREGRWTWGFGRSNSVSVAGSPLMVEEKTTQSASPSPPPTPTPLFPPMSSSAPSTPTPIQTATNSPGRRNRAQTNAGSAMGLVPNHLSWFNDPRFDGSFPSRVLPFLYLGNLNHAANVYMLHALGITHVVSVGECALVPPAGTGACGGGNSPRSHCAASGQHTPHPQGSLWIEEREGRIKVLDIKGVCDDGIDSLRSQFAPICDWIDRARLEGGKVLIHCRVGVSRSATVTIAYVMKHLNLSLVDSYLIVRSRRLSVLIQPNMRLLYNLCGWESELAHQRVAASLARDQRSSGFVSSWQESHATLDTPSALDDDTTLVLSTSTTTVHVAPVSVGSHAPPDLNSRLADPEYSRRLRAEMGRKLTWPFLAREVHLLNEKYLS